MRKWAPFVAAITLVVFVFLLIVWSAMHRPSDPIYQGKPLSEWLKGYDKKGSIPPKAHSENPSDEAVRAIGTNAIPMLLSLMEENDSDLKLKLIRFAQKQKFIATNRVPAYVWNHEAMEGFRVLGASASNAVQALIEIYPTKETAEPRRLILFSLGHIGPPAKSAVPLLVKAMGDTNKFLRSTVLSALEEIHSEPGLVVPVLKNALSDPDFSFRMLAASGLGNFGAEAKSATAALLDLLENTDELTQNIARYALSRIYAKPSWAKSPLDPAWNILTGQDYRSFILMNLIKEIGGMGTNSAPAAPGLVKFLTDRDEGVRLSTTNTLKEIDQQTATKAGIK